MIKNTFSISITLLILSASTWADDQLSCSANGLKIIYVNGVRVDKKGNDESVENIQSLIDQVQQNLDKKTVFQVEGFHNVSRGALNDVEETKAQLAEVYFGKKRIEYWKEVARAEMMNMKIVYPGMYDKEKIEEKVSNAFDQIYGQQLARDLKTKEINQNYFSQTDSYSVLSKYSARLANIMSNAYADNAVIEGLKEKILEASDYGKNKVLVIAHSQGNALLASAMMLARNGSPFPDEVADKLIYNHQEGNFWLKSTSGALHVAPPTSSTVSDYAQYIRLDADLVIGSSYYVTGVSPLAPNYSLDNVKTTEMSPTIWSKLKSIYMLRGITTGYHGMDDVYLSEGIYSIRDKNGQSKLMSEHFKDNLKEIALKLKSNCGPIVAAKARCNGSYESDGKLHAESLEEVFLSSVNDYQAVISYKDSDCKVIDLNPYGVPGIDILGPYYTCLPRNSLGGFSYYSRYDAPTISLHFKTITGDYKKVVNNPCAPGKVINSLIVPINVSN